MYKYLFLAVAGVIFFFGPEAATAFDKDGCLTCHQYPGLVKQEKADEFKVLHIDEEKYALSAHGKVSCRSCHTKIQAVPHTGITEVNCTTECHSKERAKIAAMKDDLGRFHEDEKFFITGLQNDSSCGTCHSMYPHSENRKVRAFLNMHTIYVVCEVCHLDRSSFDRVIYEWKSPEGVKFEGKPYATFYNRETGKVERHQDMISRITVYSVVRGEKRSVLRIMDNREAFEFLKAVEEMSPEEKKKELKVFHKDIAKKKVSATCNECHSAKSLLDYNKLGFSPKRTIDLKFLNIKSLITKYDTFYMPNLFGN
jgi:hypothetical protein